MWWLWCVMALGNDLKTSDRSLRVREIQTPILQRRLEEMALDWGAPVFLRLFKHESVLELWIQTQAGTYRRFANYPICRFSGELGPKQKEGDQQAPEGFYATTPGLMNPYSSYHLSFNVGYPNAFDRSLGRTGSLIMIHGSCVSIGCFAMTDAGIEEIYTLVEAALLKGQKAVPIHIFPFKFSPENWEILGQDQWNPFWRDLEKAYEAFEKQRIPPKIRIKNTRYVVEEP
ncbi:MAG: murein L,D-transpeptidase [Acidobacteria bacterium]|nr:murein L,D-transpeptidase [Acidobacteriota bacterium]